jgi:hypothetical protein
MEETKSATATVEPQPQPLPVLSAAPNININNKNEEEEYYLKQELYERMSQEPTLFDWLQQASIDGLWYWDLEKPENEWLSPEFKALFGYKVG